MIDISQVRAVRNNNPGNIDRGQPWLGLMPPAQMNPEQAGEHRFCVFVDAAHGFRAMGIILRTYAGEIPAFTVHDIISRWAPPSENNTEAYIAHVCALTGFTPDQPLPISLGAVANLVKAISTHEVGSWVFRDADLSAGLRMAGLL